MSGQLQGASGNGEATLEQIPEPSTALFLYAGCWTSCSRASQSIRPCSRLAIESTREHLSICHVSQESGVLIHAVMRPGSLGIPLSVVYW